MAATVQRFFYTPAYPNPSLDQRLLLFFNLNVIMMFFTSKVFASIAESVMTETMDA